MDFTGIGFVDKPKIIKLLAAIDSAQYSSLAGTLRNTDEALRKSLCVFLCNNNLNGAPLALDKLRTVSDPFTAVRAAAICLLAMRVTEK